jgi:hypothetical protein
MAEASAPEVEQEDLLDEFPEQVKLDVNGLMYLGHLEEEVRFCGHTFVIRTLRGDEDLVAGLVVKDYLDTVGQGRAWAWARVGLALVAIDYDEAFSPQIGPDKLAYARQRFKYVTENWYWPVGNLLYERLVDLERRQLEAMNALESLSQGIRTNSTPSPESSTEPGDSVDPT